MNENDANCSCKVVISPVFRMLLRFVCSWTYEEEEKEWFVG